MSNAAAVTSSPPVDERADLDALGDHIALLAAQIEAASHQLLLLIRDFDERGGWAGAGARSCAHWLSWRIGLGLNAAREKVRVARALANLPQLSAALEHGEISFSKVRAVTRVATPDNEAALLCYARHGTAAQVEKIVRGYRGVLRAQDAEQEERRHEGRGLAVYTDDDGMVVIRGRLSPEQGAVVKKALEVAEVRLATPTPTRGELSAVTRPAPTAEQRRADALALVAQSALDHQLERGSDADLLQVVLHVDADTLADPAQAGQCCFDGGADVSPQTARRLSCDASVVTIRHAKDGSVLDVGRKRRTIPPAIRRALRGRDTRCRFPGCDHTRYLHAHHIEHWADGGETSLDNVVLLCSRCHRLVHEGGFRIARGNDGALVFLRPGAGDGEPSTVGRPLPEVSAAPRVEDGPAQLAARNRERGLHLDQRTLSTWQGEPLDYDWAVELLLHSPPATDRQPLASGCP
jgi:5-methylcytosine-specific restriction endonuclease McrA